MQKTCLKKIDYSYCIPDCGGCCLVVCISEEEAREIARKERREISEFYDPKRNKIKIENGRCFFLSEYSMCKIYSSRPEACRNFPEDPIRCDAYWMILALERTGFGIKTKLKKMFLERVSSRYDRVNWLSTAKRYLSLEFRAHFEDLIEFLSKRLSQSTLKPNVP